MDSLILRENEIEVLIMTNSSDKIDTIKRNIFLWKTDLKNTVRMMYLHEIKNG